MKDTLQVIGVFTFLILPFILAKLWIWVFFWAIVLVIFGIFEIWSYMVDHKTLSQKFGVFRKKHPLAGFSILCSMLAGWLLLLWHLWG